MHYSLNHSIYSIVQQCSELKHTDAITVGLILFISISKKIIIKLNIDTQSVPYSNVLYRNWSEEFKCPCFCANYNHCM